MTQPATKVTPSSFKGRKILEPRLKKYTWLMYSRDGNFMYCLIWTKAKKSNEMSNGNFQEHEMATNDEPKMSCFIGGGSCNFQSLFRAGSLSLWQIKWKGWVMCFLTTTFSNVPAPCTLIFDQSLTASLQPVVLFILTESTQVLMTSRIPTSYSPSKRWWSISRKWKCNTKIKKLARERR